MFIINDKSSQYPGLMRVQMPINDTINAMLNASGLLTTDYDGIAILEGESFDTLLTVCSHLGAMTGS